MVRYFLRFSYIGTQYRGVQKQISSQYIRDVDTIQGSLEAALLTILPKTTIMPSLLLSSRTDAGVHAICNTAHVELANKYNILYKADNVKKYVNRYFNKCGHTIRLLDFMPVTHDFNARKFCKSRTYIYRFMIPKVPNEERLPLIDTQHTYYVRNHNFDVDRVRRGTELFMGLKDFTTFSSKNITNPNVKYIRALHAFTLEEAQSLVPFDPQSENFRYFQFVCKAKSFLYNQVRRMVGALIALGLGRVTEKDIIEMLQVPSHYNWNTRISTVPSTGLHLLNLEYDPEELKHYVILDEEDQKERSVKQDQDLFQEQELQIEKEKQELT